jgi:hypothetical protein
MLGLDLGHAGVPYENLLGKPALPCPSPPLSQHRRKISTYSGLSEDLHMQDEPGVWQANLMER